MISKELWSDLHVEVRRACDITTGPTQAVDQSVLNRITDSGEDHWDCRGRRLCRPRRWRGKGNNHRYTATRVITSRVPALGQPCVESADIAIIPVRGQV